MILRYSINRRPQITFTADFHQLVQGDLVAGPCVLRYDPLRIMEERNFNPQAEIHAHVRFHPSGDLWQGKLILPPNARLQDMADPAGQGVMLEAVMELPTNCVELEAWFCMQAPGSEPRWDSDAGKNFWLRFPLHDLQIARAAVCPVAGGPQDTFELQVTGVPEIEAITVRWRFPSLPEEPRREMALTRSSDAKRWEPNASIEVPRAATVIFDLVYYVGCHKFTDDNQGRWYLAD